MIITTQRHPFNSWLDRLLTLMGWFVFGYLLGHGLWLLLQHSISTTGFEQLDPIFPTLSTFFLYGLMLGMNALLLFGWSCRHKRSGLNVRRLHTKPEGADSQLSFTEEQIETVRQSQIVVLYHSQDGAVEDVKPTVFKQPPSNSLVLMPALPGFIKTA